MTTASPRPAAFDPVDTSFDPSQHARKDDVESPSLSSSNALARFEFEPGRSKDGTKVLMVEWEDDEVTRSIAGDWEIRWEGKRTVLPARDSASGEVPVNRLYFLLGPGVAIPTAVKLQKGSVLWRTNPLPAIFSPDLGATARAAGKKGVLHTIWAKKRLQVLQRELDTESKTNAEGIGFEMVLAEKEWIEQNFGVLAKPSESLSIQPPSINTAVPTLNSPTSPRSPGGSRLMDKLKGLKIGTSESELSAMRSTKLINHTTSEGAPPSYHNPLSPEGSDVAIGSFGSFAALKGHPPVSDLAAKPPQPPEQQQRRIAVQRPPEAVARQQSSGMGSLNALASGQDAGEGAAQDEADDLFALPMSPRSPEMSQSPFSFARQDTVRYMTGEKGVS